MEATTAQANELERRVDLSIAIAGVEKEMEQRLKRMGKNMKMPGFRPGKVPFNIVKENMSDFIRYAKPKRWKLFQVLPMKGQNDLNIDNFKITEEQFQLFIDSHKGLLDITSLVPESNNQMTGSYAMVDPAGRFFDNSAGEHTYSKPILDIGARLAIQQMSYNFSKFVSRGGIYKWVK